MILNCILCFIENENFLNFLQKEKSFRIPIRLFSGFSAHFPNAATHNSMSAEEYSSLFGSLDQLFEQSVHPQFPFINSSDNDQELSLIHSGKRDQEPSLSLIPSGSFEEPLKRKKRQESDDDFEPRKKPKPSKSRKLSRNAGHMSLGVMQPRSSGERIMEFVERMANQTEKVVYNDLCETVRRQSALIEDLLLRVRQLEQGERKVKMEVAEDNIMVPSGSSSMTVLDVYDHNLIPWIWVLIRLGIMLRLVTCDEEGKLCINKPLISQVTSLAMAHDTFTLKRYMKDGRIIVDDDTAENWKFRINRFFCNDDTSAIPFDELRCRVRHIVLSPEYQEFGKFLNPDFIKNCVAKLKPKTKMGMKEYCIANLSQVSLSRDQDQHLLLLLTGQKANKLVKLPDCWNIV